ncbi:hypothetical protein HETIRDRAFT_446269 [Heterobasidion irregulare TC 32-1]|uniref:Glutamine amidotransferase type-2 domain-containing protein n=1 Tax=Heterobasidion irregulare (strain TC 32-1) TaxID=747525 RepID=W4JWJ5_HETIT|nr:uncharacterized protein HETIRDRAFT_446269 [Heterobasidion irregulare TC 32-1]ETW77256.1 hypothetical protein HETIRDRAFT_446269 [Heterobasidion irregulare TC 32-1]
MFNIDDFGIAWYTHTRAHFASKFMQGPRPAMYKTVAPALTDPTFIYICGNTASSCILAHIRAASAPPVVQTNDHPFIFGRHSFMHNGTVSNFRSIISRENVGMIRATRTWSTSRRVLHAPWGHGGHALDRA